MGAHLIDGDFQSDKYPTTPRGKVPLSVRDVTAQDLLYAYAQRRRPVDAEFADDLEAALERAGYQAVAPVAGVVVVETAEEVRVIPRSELRSVTIEHRAEHRAGHRFAQLRYELVNGLSGVLEFCEGAPESLAPNERAKRMTGFLTRGQHDLRIVVLDDESWQIQGVHEDRGTP